MSWFDDSKNTTGALTTRLASDAAQVKGVCLLLNPEEVHSFKKATFGDFPGGPDLGEAAVSGGMK